MNLGRDNFHQLCSFTIDLSLSHMNVCCGVFQSYKGVLSFDPNSSKTWISTPKGHAWSSFLLSLFICLLFLFYSLLCFDWLNLGLVLECLDSDRHREKGERKARREKKLDAKGALNDHGYKINIMVYKSGSLIHYNPHKTLDYGILHLYVHIYTHIYIHTHTHIYT